MKSPLIYLTLVKLKNQVKSIFKTPSKLIYTLFLIAMFALMAFSSVMADSEPPAAYRDLSEFTAILTLLYTVMFLLVFLSGSAGNSPMFTLSDVNMLFPSPLSPNRVLFYGLFRQLGTSLLLGFFLLFQYSWVHQLYGLSYGGLLIAIGGYGLTLFLAQLCAMAVYTRTSGKENAGRWIKRIAYGAVVLYVLAAVFSCRGPISALFSGGDFSPALSAAAGFFSTLPGLLFPVSGWAAAVAGGVIQGNWLLLLTGAALILILSAVLIGLILSSKGDYYEDAIQNAETVQSAITAQKEGQYGEVVPKHVKVGKTGFKKGWGSSAIYYKHTVENRRSGVFFLSNMSLIFALCIIGFSIFMRAIDDGEDVSAVLVGAFAMGTYMQMFSATLGRFNRELIKPYLYLIPEPPLKKLLYALKENLISDCWEAVVIFIPVGSILSASPLDIVFCILARISFALLFTAGNILVERVFGTVSSKALILFFYFLVLILMAIPGIAVGIVLSIFTPLPGFVGAFLGMAAVNVLISLVVLYLCRNLLQYAELNNR